MNCEASLLKMSVFTLPEEKQSIKQEILQHLGSENRERSSVGNTDEVKQLKGIESMEQSVAQTENLHSTDDTQCENMAGLPEVLNVFYGHGLNSLDMQLTSQILSSIKNRIASNIHHSNKLPSDFVEQNSSDFLEIKQEIPDDFDEFHDSVQFLPLYPQTSQAVYQNSLGNGSVSSIESFSSSLSPDSSLLPTNSSPPFSCTSPIDINVFGTTQSDLGQGVVPTSEQGVILCDSTQAAAGEGSMCKQVPKKTNLLPPCRVCGDKASGFHYGANTCEACKGFFRRSLKKDRLDFKCNGDNNCPIQKGRRNNCPWCRYNKCLSAGMSKQAIKTGRYTHEKRTKDIVEVKTLKGELGPHMLQPSFIKMENPSKYVAKKTVSEGNRKLLDVIYSAHKIIFPLWHQVLDSGSHKILSMKYAEKYKVEKSTRSDTSSMEAEECNNYNTEIDVDEKGRKNTIDTLTKHIEISVMAFVRYAKAVPGFIDLALNDQAALVKLSRFEIWMIGAHKFMDFDLKVVTGPRGNSYHMDELSEILDEGFVRSLFNFAQSMQDIQLTNEETALLKCVALTFADRSELQEPAKVEAIQQRLTECLEELLGTGQRFAKVMNALIRLRDLTEWNKTVSESIVLEWPTMKQHPLLLEILSV